MPYMDPMGYVHIISIYFHLIDISLVHVGTNAVYISLQSFI